MYLNVSTSPSVCQILGRQLGQSGWQQVMNVKSVASAYFSGTNFQVG